MEKPLTTIQRLQKENAEDVPTMRQYIHQWNNLHLFRNDEIPHITDIVRFPTTFEGYVLEVPIYSPRTFKVESKITKKRWRVLTGFDLKADSPRSSKGITNNLETRLLLMGVFSDIRIERLDDVTTRIYCFGSCQRRDGE